MSPFAVPKPAGAGVLSGAIEAGGAGVGAGFGGSFGKKCLLIALSIVLTGDEKGCRPKCVG